MHKTSQIANRFVTRSFPLAILIVAALSTTAPRVAGAKGGHGKGHIAPKVGLPSFMGPGEAAVRAAVEKALKSRKIVVVPGDELSAAAKSAHVKLDSNDGFKAAAKALDLTAIVTGEVTKKKATLTVHTGDDGSVVGEETFQGADTKKVAATVGKTFWKRLAGPFNKTKPPSGGNFEAPPPEEEPAAAGGAEAANEAAESAPKKKVEPAERRESKEAESKEPETKEKAEPSETKREKASQASSEGGFLPPGPTDAVDVSGGFAWFMRSLSFNQPRNDLSTTQVANYSLPRAPNLVLRGDIFPAAFSSSGLAADIGLTLDLAYLLPVVTSPGVGGSYKTSALQWAIGPKVRLPYGFFGTVAYGAQSFKLTRSNSDMPEAVVPGTNYKFVRVGAGIRSQVTPTLALGANLDYLQCLGKPGDIASGSYFPRMTCNGLEVGVIAGYKIRPQWEVRAGADLRRFGLNFHVKSSDVNDDPSMTPAIAGGAVDQYIQVTVAIAYLIGGGDSPGGATSAGAEPSSDEDSPKKSKKEKKEKAESDEGGESSDGGATE